MTNLWALIVWVAYLLWPARGWGLFQGVPLAPIAWPALAAVVWIWACRPRPSAGAASSARSPTSGLGFGVVSLRWLLALLVLKALSSLVPADRGLAAQYFANAAWTPPVESDVESVLGKRNDAVTRIDRRLQFGSPGSPDLPLFFFNDPTRFNFYRAGDPDREKLAYAVSWTGVVAARDDRSATFYLEGARGVSAELLVDGFRVVSLLPAEAEAEGTVTLRSGWRRLTVRLSGEYGAPRQFEAGWTDGRTRIPMGDEDVFITRVPGWRWAIDRFVRWLILAADATMLMLVMWNVAMVAFTVAAGLRTRPEATTGSRWDLVEWRGAIAALALAAALVDALVLGWRWSGRLVLFSGGHDWLTYEHYARDIVLHGPLMRLGQPPGQGGAFYYQPLYPYFLALLHLVFGNDFGGIYAAQRLLLFTAAFALWRVTALLFGERTGAAGLAIAGAFLYRQAGLWASILPGEILFLPLVCLWAWSLVRLCAPETRGTPASEPVSLPLLSGLAGGLATLSRSTLLLAWPAAILVLLSSSRARAARARPARTRARRPWLVIAMMLLVVGLATARNWLVAGQFVLITTGFSGNLFMGNTPPPDVPQHSIAQHRFYPLFAREDTLRMTVEFARHAPRRFVEGLGRKALYTLGWFDVMTPGDGWSPLLVATWMTALGGIALAMGSGSETLGRWPPLLPAFLALAHFASVVLIFPNGGFERRLILPFYVLLLPYVAVCVTTALRAAVRGRRGVKFKVR